MTSADETPQMVTATVTLGNSEWQMQTRVTVPAGPIHLTDLLPLARGLSDAVVGAAVNAVEESGEQISCKAGCGACCRNLVAISEVEARRLGVVIENFPEPRRSEVRQRFADARRRMEEDGLLATLQSPEQLTDAEYQSLAEAYFAAHVACPFLEQESCSIYTERPVTCREYLVVSPAENCAHPTADTIRRVKMPLPVFNALARCQVSPSAHHLERWVPLILAPEWAAAHPDDPPAKPGPELLRDLLNCLSGKTE